MTTRRWGRLCPICKKKMVSDAKYQDLTLLDDVEKCELGCKQYGEHLSDDGKYVVAVKSGDDWQVFEWYYNDTSEHKQRIADTIFQLVKEVKEAWNG